MTLRLKKVLIAEDDLAQKALWENLFNSENLKVDLHWSVSCEEALKMIQKSLTENSPFDLIISDIFLAGSGTGMDLLASDYLENGKAKRILISAVEKEDIVEKFGHMLKDIEIISKPISREKYENLILPVLKIERVL